jgi:hypothetical protein
MSEAFEAQKQTNLDFILSLANVSARGKQMLIRDLNRMEEGEAQDEFQGEGGSRDAKAKKNKGNR